MKNTLSNEVLLAEYNRIRHKNVRDLHVLAIIWVTYDGRDRYTEDSRAGYAGGGDV